MAKDKIALSFEQAEYYTLQEACDYLNMKHNTDNIKPKNLFKAMVKYNIDSYIYSKGFGVSCVFGNARNYNELECKEMEIDVSRHSCHHGFLFKLNTKVTKELVFKTVTKSAEPISVFDYIFDGALQLGKLNENPKTPYILQAYGITAEIGFIALKLPSEAETDVEINLNDIVPKLNSIPTDENKFPTFQISINDIVILHKDLIALDRNITNNTPAPIETSAEIVQIRPRAGVGMEKLVAKEYAKIIAKHLWNKDGEQKIRMQEMAHLVYGEIHKSVLADQLPDNPKELQNWIKDIAPAYARKGGRPKNES